MGRRKIEMAEFLEQEPKPNVAKPNNEIGDIDGLNKQLSDVKAQICEEKMKGAELAKKLKQHEVTELFQYEELQDSYLELQRKVKDDLDA
ncbi:hypothetical protein JHK85_014043 [Glycine max]|nr:hypothetical protein JHK85_014043 [Glycine max]KAG5058689.1 hypothetical protein JHK86_013685 [Glycine max]